MRDQLFFEGDDLGRRLSRFWLLLVLAAIIASAGVVGDSTATVIGAMIVAPLMVPILGTVLAVSLTDRDNLLRCLALVIAGAVAVVVIGFLIGLTVSTPVVAETNSQVASRVSPRLIDLLAALATGAVGSVALARDDISDTLPGVAIAISLVPPLAVVGLTLESGAGAQAAGALLLFVTNVSAILTTGIVVMAIYRVSRAHRHELGPGMRVVHRRRAVAVIVASLVVISVPLALTSIRITSSESTQSTVTELAERWARGTGWEVVTVVSRPDGLLIRATGPLPEPSTDELRESIASEGLGADDISIELIPSRTIDLTPDDS